MSAHIHRGPAYLQVDMLVGDIYGKDRDYSNIGLSATTIASSFGKVVAEGKDLEDLDPADLALALCRWEVLAGCYIGARKKLAGHACLRGFELILSCRQGFAAWVMWRKKVAASSLSRSGPEHVVPCRVLCRWAQGLQSGSLLCRSCGHDVLGVCRWGKVR